MSKRWILIALVGQLVLGGCKKKEDEPCEASSDCADGLVCDDDGDETCQSPSTVEERAEKREEEAKEKEEEERVSKLEAELEKVDEDLVELKGKLEDAPDPKTVEEIADEMKPLRERRIELKKKLMGLD